MDRSATGFVLLVEPAGQSCPLTRPPHQTGLDNLSEVLFPSASMSAAALSRAATPVNDPASVFHLLAMPPETDRSRKISPLRFYAPRVSHSFRNGDHSITAAKRIDSRWPLRIMHRGLSFTRCSAIRSKPCITEPVPHSAKTGNAPGI